MIIFTLVACGKKDNNKDVKETKTETIKETKIETVKDEKTDEDYLDRAMTYFSLK